MIMKILVLFNGYNDVRSLKLLGCLNVVAWMIGRKTEYIVQKEVMLSCFIFFCMSLYTSLYDARAVSILRLSFEQLLMKWSSSKTW